MKESSVCVCIYIYMYICICIYIDLYTYIHIYINFWNKLLSQIKAIKSINILMAKFNNKKLPLPADRGPCSSGARASGPFGPWLRRHCDLHLGIQYRRSPYMRVMTIMFGYTV